MLSDLIQIPFEWFVTSVWDRHGPIAGVAVGILLLAALVGLALVTLAWFQR
jgi:hypothetical protein